MITINPYLTFDGNALEAFNFYKTVFGGEFAMMQKLKDTPHGSNASPDEAERIMHIALPLSEGYILLGSDTFASMGHKHLPGTNIALSLNAESKEEADKIFNSLSAGGTVTMPMQDTFWGSYFGMCTDKFGIAWMMSFDKK